MEYVDVYNRNTHYDPQNDSKIKPFLQENKTTGYKQHPQVSISVGGVSYLTVVRDLIAKHPRTTVLEAASKLENMARDRVELTPYQSSHDLKAMLTGLYFSKLETPTEAFQEAFDTEVNVYVTQTMEALIQHLSERTTTLERIGEKVREYCRKKYNCDDANLITSMPWPEIDYQRNGVFIPTFQYMLANEKEN